METSHPSLPILEWVVFIFLIIIFVNLSLLDFFSLKQNLAAKQSGSIIQKPQIIQVASGGCSSDCLEKIFEATQSMKPIFVTSPPALSQSSPVTFVKEYYVPLGSGSGNSSDFADVSGAAANIDNTEYSNIKTVTFEASVSIPTGNETVYVRLYNATDKHPVWFSDVSLSGGLPQLLISSPITLDTGNKLYQVQMKTSLSYQAVLAQSRVHIVTY